MKDPRIDVILENLNLVCKFYEVNSCGTWCNRAYGSKNYNDQPKYVNCKGHLKNCELTEDDRINLTGEWE